jgi:hypothetical protein
MPITTLISSADTYGRSGDAGGNYGALASPYWVGHATAQGQIRALLKFDLSTIPSYALINTVTLRMYRWAYYGANNATINLYRCLRDWVEMQATWNSWKTGNAWQTPMAEGAADRDTIVLGSRLCTPGEGSGHNYWTITPSVVQDWVSGVYPNYGFVLRATVENLDLPAWYAREQGPPNEPTLIVDWDYPEGRLARYKIAAVQAGARLRTSLDGVANKTWLRYSLSGVLTRSTPVTDADSLAKYGTKEQPLSGGDLTATVATQASHIYLDEVSDPSTPDIDLSVSAGVVYDNTDDQVPPESVRPNNWIVLTDLPRPTSEVYETLIQDPRMAYIEEVQYDEDADRLMMKSGRDRFAETLVNRLVGRA